MDSVLSPVSTGPGSMHQASSAELVGESPRRTSRAKRRMRPVRVVETSVGGLRLWASIAPCVIESEWYWPIVGASYSSVSQCGCGLTISGGGGDSDGLVVPELGVAPLKDSGTDLEDELPTPDDSPSTH